MKPKILIVEDQKSSRELLTNFLIEQDYDVYSVGSGEKALEAFHKQGFSLALLDIRLPGMDGIELLEKLHDIDPEFIAIFMTAFGSVENAVKGMSRGAFGYIQKPVNLKQLLILVEKALEKWFTESESKILKEQIESQYSSDMIAESPNMKDVLSLINRIAPTDVAVLITGESGTGKEVIAHAIHDSSHRKDKRFIALNCAALPDNLVESELFGFEPGAFSGASQRKRGLAEMADGGTIFLDEIGEFPINLQAKLLRMIEGNGFYRIGGIELLKPDIRIIAATNRDLKDMTEEKQFRQDLYFRLKGIKIDLPPLRKRPEDIIALSDTFLEKFAKKYNRNIKGFTKEARNAMLRYEWPGNIRELINSIESAIVIARKDHIGLEDIRIKPEKAENDESITPSNMTLEELEKAHIRRVLADCDGNISKASQILGIHRNTLSSKVKEYGLN
ncbi:MAG: sigma-54-dependent transcriptional regulator [Candidatus Zixiibacteriota bacterium]